MSSIRYIIWKKNNTAIITFDPNEIFNLNKNEIKSIFKDNGIDRTYTTCLYIDTQQNNPEKIIERFDSIYRQKMNFLETYHMVDIDKKIIHEFNKN